MICSNRTGKNVPPNSECGSDDCRVIGSSVEFDVGEVNYGAYSELEKATADGCTFIAWNGEGGDYGPAVTVGYGGKGGSTETTRGQEPVIRVDRYGAVSAEDKKSAAAFAELERRATDHMDGNAKKTDSSKRAELDYSSGSLNNTAVKRWKLERHWTEAHAAVREFEGTEEEAYRKLKAWQPKVGEGRALTAGCPTYIHEDVREKKKKEGDE